MYMSETLNQMVLYCAGVPSRKATGIRVSVQQVVHVVELSEQFYVSNSFSEDKNKNKKLTLRETSNGAPS